MSAGAEGPKLPVVPRSLPVTFDRGTRFELTDKGRAALEAAREDGRRENLRKIEARRGTDRQHPGGLLSW